MNAVPESPTSAPVTLPIAPAAAKPTYPPTAAQPTQAGPDGIRFDFNDGCRVLLPTRDTGAWRVRLKDLDTGNILFESENQGALVRSAKRWYVRFQIEVWSLEDGAPESPPLLTHAYDPAGHDVLLQFSPRHSG